jgi:hypothetical protein
MKTTTLMLALAILGSIGLSSCSKYEDGPIISLRSKKERIANTWRVEKAMDSGSEVTSSFDQYRLEMRTNGAASLAAVYSLGSLNFEFETSGTWSLENSNEDLRLDFENDDADRTYIILRLMEKELWLREKGGSLELHLEPA